MAITSKIMDARVSPAKHGNEQVVKVRQLCTYAHAYAYP